MAITAQAPIDRVSFEAHWAFTPEKLDSAIAKLAQAANPLRIVLFGSRARSSHRSDSDVDLAVILDKHSKQVSSGDLYRALQGREMSIDILVADLGHHERFAKSINSVHYDIQREGVVLYERNRHGSAGRADAA